MFSSTVKRLHTTIPIITEAGVKGARMYLDGEVSLGVYKDYYDIHVAP